MNLKLTLYLAQGAAVAAPEEMVKTTKWGWMGSGETMLVVGLATVLGLGLFAWAFFFRKRRPSDPHRRVIEAGATAGDGTPASDPSPNHRHRRRHHRHRRSSHTHRNPTLQETGGLPAPRPDDQPPPF
jgi:hypothetical protein